MTKTILRVDMSEGDMSFEDFPEKYAALGGYGALHRLLFLMNVPPNCDALGPHNKIVIAPG